MRGYPLTMCTHTYEIYLRETCFPSVPLMPRSYWSCNQFPTITMPIKNPKANNSPEALNSLLIVLYFCRSWHHLGPQYTVYCLGLKSPTLPWVSSPHSSSFMALIREEDIPNLSLFQLCSRWYGWMRAESEGSETKSLMNLKAKTQGILRHTSDTQPLGCPI